MHHQVCESFPPSCVLVKVDCLTATGGSQPWENSTTNYYSTWLWGHTCTHAYLQGDHAGQLRSCLSSRHLFHGVVQHVCVPDLAFQLIEADIQFNCISNTTLSLNVNTRHGISQSTEQSDPFYGSILRSVNFESTHQLPCINLLHVLQYYPCMGLEDKRNCEGVCRSTCVCLSNYSQASSMFTHSVKWNCKCHKQAKASAEDKLA